MLAALTAIVLVCALEQPLPYRLLVIAGGIYVIARHRANIRRLLAGTEPRLGQSSPDLSSNGGLVPTFRSPCSIAATPFTDFGKLWALANL